jgi:hypothetical protein
MVAQKESPLEMNFRAYIKGMKPKELVTMIRVATEELVAQDFDLATLGFLPFLRQSTVPAACSPRSSI